MDYSFEIYYTEREISKLLEDMEKRVQQYNFCTDTIKSLKDEILIKFREQPPEDYSWIVGKEGQRAELISWQIYQIDCKDENDTINLLSNGDLVLVTEDLDGSRSILATEIYLDHITESDIFADPNFVFSYSRASSKYPVKLSLEMIMGLHMGMLGAASQKSLKS